ncbi:MULTISPECIES: cell wall-binding repeat-containing protein [unclassified Microbacterium]|uniref:cell wall-binding repeat-containing protein n=1 Tax=unclassified Microbacterium TaxID=2609290 RepID=UPI00160526DA|nr:MULTISPECIES: cell wall-binding repeat-containing protein [unclassified Microbacterium]QNA92284.1 cell wall-binding repeat-containing protein [Microbacterium sp. Se63.02b]QYM65558.1 cell wall-binding repeat-containing protein [Microbacterium sp. Se5.02b]
MSPRSRRRSFTVVLTLALAVATPLAAHPAASATTAAQTSVERIFGTDRYETAAAVSADAFSRGGVITAFVASGVDFPDALSAAATAGLMDGPVLLTKPGYLPAVTAQEVDALELDSVFVTGGTGAVSDTVLRQLEPLTAEGSFRFGGADRYATAAAMLPWWTLEFPDTVFLASGADYPDALSGAAAAGFLHSPVLLTAPDALPAQTADALRRLAPSTVIALGGTGSLSDAVLESARLATGVDDATTERRGGQTRYDTAVSVSQGTFATGARVPIVYVASGENFADALAGAAAGGSLGGPVLLTPAQDAPAAVLAELRRLDPQRVVILGGPSVISDHVATQIAAALG